MNKYGKQKHLGNCDATELNYVYTNSLLPGTVEAAKLVLKEDFRMEPPKAEKRTVEQNQRELGFS